MNNTEFYIGWMPKAPVSFVRTVRKALIILFPLALLVGLLLASFQKKFSLANFEYGRITEVKGIYFNTPVPMLKVVNGKDIWSNASYTTVPLVGYGKHGAETAILEMESEKNMLFNNKELTLKGTLLYSDGKTLLQISKEDNPVITIGKDADVSLLPGQKDLGVQRIKGEIIDPKCYFGVMKPGEGKVHRDCAIRCILGGIPPILKVMNEKGEKDYYFIVGPNGEKMNNAVQDLVAEPVEIEARVVQQDDWVILYVQEEHIKRIASINLIRPGKQVVSCVTTCMK